MASDEIKKEPGEKRTFSTGAKKQAAAGKGTPVLVPGDAIIDVAIHFEKGADVHGARNWEKGIPLSELLNSLERHLQQLKLGMIDEPHGRAMVWNAIVYLATKLRIERGQLPANLDDMTECRLKELQEPYMCPNCSGTGEYIGVHTHTHYKCTHCKGTGKMPPPPKNKTVTCGRCDGTGEENVGKNCLDCKGTGTQPVLDGRN